MTTIIKKVLYTGVGLAATTAEKVQQRVNDLIDVDGSYEKEGKKMVDSFLNTADDRREKVTDKVKDIVESVTDKLDLASRSDYDSMKKKISKLERELKAANGETKKVVKRTVVKKSK